MKQNMYETVKKRTGSVVYSKVVGGERYDIVEGFVDPYAIVVDPVDHDAKMGNPRLRPLSRKIKQIDPKHGPITPDEQAGYFRGEFFHTAVSDYRGYAKDKRQFALLKEGIRLNGESQDMIVLDHRGVVLEGHRRTFVFQQLKREEPANFDFVRAVVLPKGVSLDDVRGMLTLRHARPADRWSSDVQAEILIEIEDSGMTAKDISKRYAIPISKISQLTQAGRYQRVYQQKTGDLRPEKFSTWLKVVENGTLRAMLFGRTKSGRPPKEREDGLGEFVPGLLDRFYTWVKKDLVNARQDVADMTSDEIGFLRHKDLWKVIDNYGAKEARRRIMALNAASHGKPGLRTIAVAVRELNKLPDPDRAKLAANKTYVNELLKLQSQLDTAIAKLSPRRAAG